MAESRIAAISLAALMARHFLPPSANFQLQLERVVSWLTANHK